MPAFSSSYSYASITTETWRLGFNREQGFGFSEIKGSYPQPEAGVHPIFVPDQNDQMRVLVFDYAASKIYESSARTGPIGSNIYKINRDKEGVDHTISNIIIFGNYQTQIYTEDPHGFITGETIGFRNVGGTTGLNNMVSAMINVDTTTRFTLTTTEDFPFGDAWTGGGVCFKAGIDITPEVWLGEDTADDEARLIRLQKQFIYTRPLTEENRGMPGFDANGYPLNLSLAFSIFKDGEQVTATSSMASIALPKHQLAQDRVVEGHRIWEKILANKSGFSIIGIHKRYVATDIPPGPDDAMSTEQDYQEELALPSNWIAGVNNTVMDRCTGTEIAGTWTWTPGTLAVGPDGGNTGMLIYNPSTNIATVSIGATGELWFWYRGTLSSVTIGSAVTMVAHGTSGLWTFVYAKAVNKSGTLVINRAVLAENSPTSDFQVSDIRIFPTVISTGARTYYYNNMINNNGDIVLPM